MGQGIVEARARARVRGWACVGLLAITAHCGKDSKNPGGLPEAGSGGEGAAAAAGAAGGPIAAAGDAGQNQGGAGMAGAAGDSAAGAAGMPVDLDCEREEIKLRLVTYEDGSGDEQQVAFEYDQAGRLAKATFSDDNQYTYFYDDEERIERVNSAYNEETHSFSITYGSESERYQDDDMSTSVMVELAGARWLKTVVSDVSGNVSSTSVPTWENGLITQIATTAVQQETLATYSYDVDSDDRPVRMVEVGQPEPKTLEVYDDDGRHLFQAVYATGSEPVGVRLYRDNVEPVRSLLARVYPEAVASNDWLWASFDMEAADSIGQGLVGLRRPKPLDLVPWQPLVFDKNESFDFAKDLDGDDEEDVAARYTFDEQDRLSTFVLELGQAPRVTVQMTYTPELVTETIEYLDGPAEERRYHYGCDDFTPP